MTALLAILLSVAPPVAFHDRTPQEQAMQGVTIDPGAPAAYLERVEDHDDEAGVSTVYVRLKIFRDEGKKYADIELPYLVPYDGVSGIEARMIRPDGTIAKFDGIIRDKLLVRVRKERLMAKTFSLPDAQPGSIIEYRYSRTWQAHTRHGERFMIQRELPILSYTLRAKACEKESYYSYFTALVRPGELAPRKNGNVYELNLLDVPALEEEPYAPPREQRSLRVELSYASRNMGLAEFWGEAAELWGEETENFIGDRPGIRKAARQMTAAASTPEEQLRLLYAAVHDFRNTTFDEEKTEQETKRERLGEHRHAGNVLHERYGTASDLTRLFVALARGVGLSANVVRIAPRDGVYFTRDLPVSDLLDDEVAVVYLGGKARWFDPGTPQAPFGLLSWEKTDVDGLRLTRGGGSWVTTPRTEAADGLTKREASLRLEGDKLLGTITLTWSGQEALARRLQHRYDDESVTHKALEDEVLAMFPDGSRVGLRQVEGLKATETPLVATFDVELLNLASTTGSRTFLPLAVFSASVRNPFAAEGRRNPVYFDFCFRRADEVTLQLPEHYMLESVPTDAKLAAGAASYATHWEKKEGAVTLQRSLTINTIGVALPLYRVIRDFYGKFSTYDRDAVVLRKVSP
jgi:hypothetical protein